MNNTGVVLSLLAMMSSSSSALGYYYYSNTYTSSVDGIYEGDVPVKPEEDLFKIRKLGVEIFSGKIAMIYYNDRGSVVLSTGCIDFTKDGNNLKFTLPMLGEGGSTQKIAIGVKDSNTIVVDSDPPTASNPPVTLKKVTRDKFGCNKVEPSCSIM
jgi:hypothetical protein